MADNKDMRQKLIQRWGQLKNERSSWMAHWQEISTYLLPTNGRFFRQDRNKGNRRANSIYDSEATGALDVLAAGMVSGATSPARPWFRLSTPNTELNENQAVKVWLNDVTQRMLRVFRKSNTYDSLHELYLELGSFGTGACVIMQDFDNVIHCYPLTAGEYAISTDAKGRVCTLFREYEMTVSQMVKEFGLTNCSLAVQSAFNSGNGLDQWFPVVHAIEPRADRNPNAKDSKNMAWGSYYFELTGDQQHMLRESGFKQFPGVCPRWTKVGGDIYGRSPAMNALGDIKQLQHEQLRKANAIDYQTNPPLQIPTNMKNQEVNRLPGGITFIDSPNGATIKSAFEVNLDLSHLLLDIRDVRDRVRSRFYTDLFLMINQMEVGKMTATEVAARQEEKMLMLGPVVERLNHELLQPIIEITFTHMMEGGVIPPPPPELSGMTLSVEFVSVLAQAQQAIGTTSMDRFTGTLGVIAQLKPDVLDKFDSDFWAENYSEKLGVDPSLIVPQDQVDQIRQARAKAQAAQAQAAAMQQNSQTAKNLAQAPTQGGQSNGLQDVMNQFSGYGG